ncbi:MAG: 2-amino-4-hydroxy-6-hydroxymethyldihydropteridine diphosphokinase [Chthoniobacterales bacterium]
MRTAVALGSNLGDRLANLRAARQAIVQLPNVRPPLLSSPIYETNPLGCESGAGKFLNAVVEFGYDGEPFDLLQELRRIEAALGRPPEHPRNVSRQIDIDLLYVGDVKIDTKELQLPHPRMHERGFVLQPLADIHPDLVLPEQTKSISHFLGQVRGQDEAVRINQTF